MKPAEILNRRSFSGILQRQFDSLVKSPLLRISLRFVHMKLKGNYSATIMISAAILLLVSYSCEEPTEDGFSGNPPLKMVVEAMLTNVPGENYVKLSLPVSNPNEEPVMVSFASIVVSDGTNVTILTEDLSEPGTYRPEATARGVTGKIYKINLRIGEYADSAYTYIIPVTPLGEMKTKPDNSREGYYFISPENSNDPAMIFYSIVPPGCSVSDSCHSEFREYILSSFDVSQIFSPKKETLSFPTGSKVIRKKYSLNPQHEAYIRSLLLETEWRGGLFDVQAGNPRGNFSESTLGYFSGCSLVMDTVVVGEIEVTE